MNRTEQLWARYFNVRSAQQAYKNSNNQYMFWKSTGICLAILKQVSQTIS